MPDPVDDLAALRRVAEAAEDHDPSEVLARVNDRAFRAAFSPAVALRLLARLEAAEQEAEVARGVCMNAVRSATEIANRMLAAERVCELLWPATTTAAMKDALTAWRATQQETPDAPR